MRKFFVADKSLHEFGGMKEICALNYVDGIYRKYFVKLPALFYMGTDDGWHIKNLGIVNLERK